MYLVKPWEPSHFKLDVDGTEASKIVSLMAIDADYIPLMQMELREGRNFDPDRPTDPQSGVILNEACIRFPGYGGYPRPENDPEHRNSWSSEKREVQFSA